MTKLNQIIAVEKGAKGGLNQAITSTYHLIQKPELFSGISRTYKPRDDDGEILPPESTKVQNRADNLLTMLSVDWTKLLDMTATKDWANTGATADVIVDGVTIIEKAPAVYLVWLEKQLVELRTVISKLPVLDPAFDWEASAAAAAWATQVMKTTRSRKVMRSQVLYDATPEHPAQVESYTEDEIAGDWSTIKFSGALPQARVNELLARVDAVSKAVKFAREHANSIDVTEVSVGSALFNYVLA